VAAATNSVELPSTQISDIVRGTLIIWHTTSLKFPLAMNSRHFLPQQTAPHRRHSSKNSTVGDDLIEVDHKIPYKDGGTDQFDNLQPLHRHCHDVKTARDFTHEMDGTDDNSRIVE
jgi:5-methylcytosine-specific restriction endonuclease McrA